MAEQLPQIIPKPIPSSIASYDNTDLASGLGYQNFYAVTTELAPSIAKVYLLVDDTSLYSNTTSTSTSTTATLNFDTSAFNIPRTAKGTAIVNFCVRNAVASTTNCFFSAQIKKVASDGTTLTNISSVFTLYHDGTNGSSAMSALTSENFMAFMPLTQTIIKRDEKLRLTIILTDNDTETIAVYHDPTGLLSTGSTSISSQMKLKMPFRVDA